MNLNTVKNLIVYLLITTLLFCTFSCYKRVPVTPQEEGWARGTTWVKATGYDHWIKVTKVEADSVYGKVRMSLLDETDRDVVVSTQDIEAIERDKIDPVMTGVVVAFVAATLLLIRYFSFVSELQ